MAMSSTDEWFCPPRPYRMTSPTPSEPGTQARRRKARRTAALLGLVAVAIFVLSIVQMLR